MITPFTELIFITYPYAKMQGTLFHSRRLKQLKTIIRRRFIKDITTQELEEFFRVFGITTPSSGYKAILMLLWQASIWYSLEEYIKLQQRSERQRNSDSTYEIFRRDMEYVGSESRSLSDLGVLDTRLLLPLCGGRSNSWSTHTTRRKRVFSR